MLTFAPPPESPSFTTWMGALAAPLAAWFTPDPAAAPDPEAPAAPAAPAAASDPPLADAPQPWLGTSEAGPAGAHASYWPCERLNAFILQMAARGHCVNAAMMLGHRAYAQQQLAQAMAGRDDALRALAAELHAYFEAPPEAAARQLSCGLANCAPDAERADGLAHADGPAHGARNIPSTPPAGGSAGGAS